MDTPSPRPRVLLIHGAWQGAWVWEGLTPYLLAAGLDVDAPDLPGNGGDNVSPLDVSLGLYIEFLSRRLDGWAEPVAIVAHSGGGVIASQLAEHRPERIACIVYLAGMMLPSGMGFAELIDGLPVADLAAQGIGPHLIWSHDRRVSRVPVQAAVDIFLQDVPHDQAVRAAKRLTPQGERGRALVATLTPERFGRTPRLYVEAIHDRSVVLEAQRAMQALSPGAEVVSLPTGHAPHVAAPELTAQAILPTLKRWLR